MLNFCPVVTVRPNDGFLRQLELYHSMGCNVDLSFPAYRKYRLDLLAEQMQKGILQGCRLINFINRGINYFIRVLQR